MCTSKTFGQLDRAQINFDKRLPNLLVLIYFVSKENEFCKQAFIKFDTIKAL